MPRVEAVAAAPGPSPKHEDYPPADKYVDCGEVRPLPMYHFHTLLRHREEYAANFGAAASPPLLPLPADPKEPL
jgi:hypothetical protein